MVSKITPFLPAIITLVSVVGLLALINYMIRRNLTGELSVARQFTMLLLTAAGILIVIFSLPLTETSRGQVLSLLGIVVTAVIALSSTTFVANIMAGLMLRAVNSFRPGDFIRSENHFGKVTERGLFHTEIQTEDRDLTTLPNLYLVNNPVSVVHTSGTIISANLSLGYDVSHVQIEELLKKAATEIGLEDAFVLVGELNDFSVSYRVGGFTADVGRLLTIKSGLRKSILTILHESGVEIVSPNFMNQRALVPGEKIIPERFRHQPTESGASSPEDVIFEKADTAAEREALKLELVHAQQELVVLGEKIKAGEGSEDTLARQRDFLKARIGEIETDLQVEPDT